MNGWANTGTSWVMGLLVGALGMGGLLSAGVLTPRDRAVVNPEEPLEVAVAPTQPPNVVLVVVCTLRRDQLSIYGGHPHVSPNLTRWAREGVVFEHAYSAAPWTKAASTAVMTGYHAIQVGMIEPDVRSNRRRLAEEVTTLAEVFGGGGYYTLGLTANPNTNREFGFAQGFDAYVQATDQWRDGMVKVSGPKMVDLALKELDDREDTQQPVYLRMMILDPHAPMSVSMKDAKRWRQKEEDVPARMLKYRHLVNRADRAIGALERGLAERGMDASNTVFAVVNDHGEGLRIPVHHGMGHGNLTLSTTVSMPWVMYGAGVAHGGRVGGVASQTDVMPTLLGLAGLEAPPVSGQDWTAQVRGAVAATTRELAFVDTWFQQANRYAAYSVERSCHYDGREDEDLPARGRRLPQTTCYDQTVDPYQMEPLAHVEQSVVDRMHEWRAGRLSEYEAFAHKEDVDLDVDLMEQLSALGYVDEGVP